MNNQLQIFKSEKFGQVRTLLINNEPHFVGKDVAEALGYTNPQKAIRDHVDLDDKGMNKMDTPSGKQSIVIINESGLYSLILGSKLEKAKEFKRWVTSKILPSIRKTGSYSSKNRIDEVLEIIKGLPQDEYKNEAVTALMKLIPMDEMRASTRRNELDVNPLLGEFLQDESVILRRTENGLAVDGVKFFNFFSNHGYGKSNILDKLDNAGLIHHSSYCRTAQIRIGNGDRIRVIILK